MRVEVFLFCGMLKLPQDIRGPGFTSPLTSSRWHGGLALNWRALSKVVLLHFCQLGWLWFHHAQSDTAVSIFLCEELKKGVVCRCRGKIWPPGPGWRHTISKEAPLLSSPHFSKTPCQSHCHRFLAACQSHCLSGAVLHSSWVDWGCEERCHLQWCRDARTHYASKIWPQAPCLHLANASSANHIWFSCHFFP